MSLQVLMAMRNQPRLFVVDFAVEPFVDVVVCLDKSLLSGIVCHAHVAQVYAAHALDAVAVQVHQLSQRLLAGIFCIGRHRPSTSFT